MAEVPPSVETPGAAPAGDAGQQEQGKAQEAAGQAQEKAREVADQAKEQAGQAADQAKGRVRDQVDERSTQAGEQVSATASDLRSVGEELRKQGKDTPARLADQAAERSERLGSYLTESDADRILRDVEDFARRQPWAVVAGGLALGFAASRFLKASSSQRYATGGGSNGARSTGGGNGAAPTGSESLPAPSGSPHAAPRVHTTPAEGHPAGDGVRTDREIGGPTSPPDGPGGATGAATGTRAVSLESHE